MGGVIWVLKDGELNVEESIAAECEETEETGTLETFASVISARTLVGHDKEGRVMIVHIEGKTYRNGYVDNIANKSVCKIIIPDRISLLFNVEQIVNGCYHYFHVKVYVDGFEHCI